MRLLFAFLMLMTTATTAQESRGFRDWTVHCDATGYCAAEAYVNPGAGSADYVFRIARHAQESYWEMSFSSLAAQADEWADFGVSIDGETQTFALFDQVGAYGQISDFYFLGDGAQVVMDRLMPGSEVAVAFTDTTGAAQEASFSLAGLSAALLWIDERQGRIGSERVAYAPPYGLVPAGSSQVAIPDVPLALLDRHRADPDCTPLEELANSRDFVVDQLDETHTLYLLPCQTGAYNFAQKVYVGSYDSYEPQYFADYDSTLGWYGTPYMWNAQYDSETKTIASFAKARGIGDCGSMGVWRWAGYQFRLEELRSRECTDDIDPEGEMPEFPVVFKAKPLPDATK
jgi:hypothetical protein